MNKRERLEKTLAGELTDHVPVTVWRHFPGDDQRAADLARSAVDFQRAFDWDVAVIAPANTYAVIDYGAQDVWNGSPDGRRIFPKHLVQRSLDWTSLRTLDPSRGMLGRVYETVRMVSDALDAAQSNSVPLMLVVYSPLTQARDLVGDEQLGLHMRTQADRVHSGLNTLTDTLLRFLDSLRRLPLAGILYVITHANYAALSEDEYASFGLPYDRKVIDSLPSKYWLNMTFLAGTMPMFKFAPALKSQIFGWHDRDNEPSLPIGKTIVNGAVCGGVAVHDHLLLGTPVTVRDAARESIQQTGARRLLLAAGGFVPVTTPQSNLRALREAVL